VPNYFCSLLSFCRELIRWSSTVIVAYEMCYLNVFVFGAKKNSDLISAPIPTANKLGAGCELESVEELRRFAAELQCGYPATADINSDAD
jgi:hypothetical protein